MKAAALVLEKEETSAFYSDTLRRIPFYNGKPWFLPVMMNWYKLKDRLTGTMK